MEPIAPVAEAQSVGDSFQHPNRVHDRGVLVLTPRVERRPFDELHRTVDLAADRDAAFKDRDDRGVTQGGAR